MRSVISVIGKDAVGITAKVSAICAKRNVNIIDITQSVLDDIFAMVMLTELPNEKDVVKVLNSDFSELSESTGLEIRVMNEDVFNSMHKI